MSRLQLDAMIQAYSIRNFPVLLPDYGIQERLSWLTNHPPIEC